MTNGGLNTKQEKIVTIAAFTANGNLQKLNTALSDGLDAGLTINEIKEILVQMYAYAGLSIPFVFQNPDKLSNTAAAGHHPATRTADIHEMERRQGEWK